LVGASDPQTSDLAVALNRIWEELLVNGTAKQLRHELRNDICRIARESLVNAIRHSGAKRVELELEYSDMAWPGCGNAQQESAGWSQS
jgi:signal transduction histidine kinase